MSLSLTLLNSAMLVALTEDPITEKLSILVVSAPVWLSFTNSWETKRVKVKGQDIQILVTWCAHFSPHYVEKKQNKKTLDHESMNYHFEHKFHLALNKSV